MASKNGIVESASYGERFSWCFWSCDDLTAAELFEAAVVPSKETGGRHYESCSLSGPICSLAVLALAAVYTVSPLAASGANVSANLTSYTFSSAGGQIKISKNK